MTSRKREPRFEIAGRISQGAFRDTSETISFEGRSPLDDKGIRNRHLLTLGHEEENLFPGLRGTGGAIEFFRERGIKWWKSPRSGDSTGDGPTRNMASSQVACVNFMLPLANWPGALTMALQAIDADVLRVADVEYHGNASPVEFEWIGIGGSLEGGKVRGANNTSIDAFLIAETASGKRWAYLFEWKYVEQYYSSKPNFKGAGRQGETRRSRYEPAYYAACSSFDHSAAPEMEDFFYEPFYQIMRQRLLADRMVEKEELGVTEAKVVVVVPQQNIAYREIITSPPLKKRFPQLQTVEDVVRASLKRPEEQFAMVSPATLLNATVAAEIWQTSTWADYWRNRYGV